MLALLSSLLYSCYLAASFVMPLLAQADEGDKDERSFALEVGVLLLCIVLGMLVTVRSSRRTTEFKKPQAGD